MRKSNRPPEPGARGLLRLCCSCCGKEFGTPRCANVHWLPLRGYDFTGTWPCAV